MAGALHALGVDMGTGHLQPPDAGNPRGYYEDLRWQKLNRKLSGAGYKFSQPKSIPPHIAERFAELGAECDRRALWGMKDARLCFTAGFIWHYLEDPRIVAVYRKPMASAESIVRHSERAYHGQERMDINAAMTLRDEWADAMEERLLSFPGAVHVVCYEDLLCSPEDEVCKLARFVGEALSVLLDEQAAVAFVDRRLDHHG